MERRAFLAGAGAVVIGACASPERQLVTRADVDSVDLSAGRPQVTVPVGEPVVLDDPGEADEPGAVIDVVDVPEKDRRGLVLVAEATGDTVVVHDGPAGDAVHTFADPIPSGGPLVFVVEEIAPGGWYRVLLPVRPNGATGWVDERSVTLTRHNYRIEVVLDEFRLTAFDHEVSFFEATVGVATENTPTPGGRYYITELIQPEVPDSIYGIYAYGLSGYSEVLEEFAGGPGQLGLHGTNDPDSIGTRVSSGCIRLANEDIALLVERGIPLGTPVEVI